MSDYYQKLEESRQYWDNQASAFDAEPDHGLLNPVVRDAWVVLLTTWLPSQPVSILDIGCGTGSLSLVMAEMHHHVVGIDFSEEMIAKAESKAKEAGYLIPFKVMDAFEPQLSKSQFRVIVCRHLLWAMPLAQVTLLRWSKLLLPEGRIILVEGYWNNSGGLRAEQVIEALPSALTVTAVADLSSNDALWGTKVNDERYLIVADYLP